MIMREVKTQFINPDTVCPPGGHYSHGVCANGMLFISGQLPITADGHKMAGDSFEHQAQQVMRNITHILLASGSSVDRIVQVRVYLTDLEHWPLFNRLYQAWLGDVRPARCVVPVPALHYGFAIEMEAVALVDA